MADEKTYEEGDFEGDMEDEDMDHAPILDDEEEMVDIEIGEEIPLVPCHFCANNQPSHYPWANILTLGFSSFCL